MRAVILAVATCLLLPAVAAAQWEVDVLLPQAGTCAHADDATAHHGVQRRAMHCLLSEVRATAALPDLRESARLRHSATYKARRIAACRFFSHYPCGDRLATPFQRVQLTRRGGWIVGENLAYGVGQEASPRAIVLKWLQSPPHFEVLLDPDFTYAGIRRRRIRMRGAPEGAVIWVAHLGVPRVGVLGR
jgi:uncharacterized protein YkwD